jgi:hypothetical protein
MSEHPQKNIKYFWENLSVVGATLEVCSVGHVPLPPSGKKTAPKGGKKPDAKWRRVENASGRNTSAAAKCAARGRFQSVLRLHGTGLARSVWDANAPY